MSSPVQVLKGHFFYEKNSGSLKVRIWHPNHNTPLVWNASELGIPLPKNLEISAVNGTNVLLKCEINGNSLRVLSISR